MSLIPRDPFESIWTLPLTTWLPFSDLQKTKSGFELTMELPGMKKEDIIIEIINFYVI